MRFLRHPRPEKSSPPRRSIRSGAAFTLVELLVACSVLTLLLGLLLSATDSASNAIRYASAKIEAFSSARAAFDIVTQKLSQATLNTYWDYYDSEGKRRTGSGYFVPTTYGRASDLQFFVRQNKDGVHGHEIFFQAPDAFSANAAYQSTQGLLNACGFFVRYGSNDTFRPLAMSTGTGVGVGVGSLRYRYRLMGAVEPTENLTVFQNAPADDTVWADVLCSSTADLSNPSKPYARPLVDNVIALIAWPRLSVGDDPDGTQLTGDYTYDSQKSNGKSQPITFGQLPPTVQITMVIIDEASASRLDTGSGTPPVVVENALRGKFQIASQRQYQQDLDDLGDALTASHINYQILTTSVVLRESKWSQ